MDEGSKNHSLYSFFKQLDRSRFMDGEYKDLARCDNAFPIGYGQTISQPTLVYEMTRRLKLEKNLKVLEIGTGSGYQTAFLAEFAREVFTVELIPELSEKAEERLKSLGYGNIKFRIGDGSEGWEEHAPYDRIIVTAAASRIPQSLVEQLGSPGRMIVPVGERYAQDLLLIIRDTDGTVGKKSLGEVVFVEFKGRYGWNIG